MTMHTIRLPGGDWEYDDAMPLGKAGGFGEVFSGRGKAGAVAIKRLKINADQAAHRELKIGQQLMEGTFDHVVPVLAAGKDAESERYFLVMPVCEFSLQDKIDEADGLVDFELAKSAINDIVSGLCEVSSITHRDLKPANVLYHEATWKIADFGIAKFVEDTTSMDTLRNSLTPAYAAPEQWKGDRPTTATDIYALGCIIHALFTGHPPFGGSMDDLRDSHLHGLPETLTYLSPRYSAFISHMLRKSPGGRPTLERCSKVLPELELLNNSSKPSNFQMIDQAARLVAEREAQEEATRQAAATLRKERADLFSDAKASFFAIRDKLFVRLRESSESVKIDQKSHLVFGDANLDFSQEPKHLDDFLSSRHARDGKFYSHTGWDVIAWSMIGVSCKGTSYTWSSSLLFANLNDGNGFRWYEIAFWTWAQYQTKNEPYGLEGYQVDIDLACGNVMHSVNVAYGPSPIDSEDEERFITRWIGLVAKAAIGNLVRPNTMPIVDFI